MGRARVRTQFCDRRTECLDVFALPFFARSFARGIQRGLRVLLGREFLENFAPRRRDGVLRKIVSFLQSLFETPERGLEKAKNGLFKRLRAGERVLGVVGRKRFPPSNRLLLGLRERASFFVQFIGHLLECSQGGTVS